MAEEQQRALFIDPYVLSYGHIAPQFAFANQHAPFSNVAPFEVMARNVAPNASITPIASDIFTPIRSIVSQSVYPAKIPMTMPYPRFPVNTFMSFPVHPSFLHLYPWHCLRLSH